MTIRRHILLILLCSLEVYMLVLGMTSQMFIPHNDVRYPNFTSEVTGIKSSLQCCRLCMRTDKCVLVSYENKEGTCQLSNGNSEAFVGEVGWDVYRLSEITECDAPCLNGGKCSLNGTDWYCDCPALWTGDQCQTAMPCPGSYGFQFGSSCYLLLSTSRNYEASRAECKNEDGGHLAYITSGDENDHVFDIISSTGKVNNGVWIGLGDQNKEGSFVWGNGDPIIYNNWKSNNVVDEKDRDCVDISFAKGEWRARQCIRKKAAICEYP